MTADDLVRILDLRPLTVEGGYFGETYRAPLLLSGKALPQAYNGPRSVCTAMFYLLTDNDVSLLHRLPGDELYHFYLGDPVRLLQLGESGTGSTYVLGQDLAGGMRLQHLVPGGSWQGSRLVEGGKFALVGTTMAPGFDFTDFIAGNRRTLLQEYAQFADEILRLTHEP